ncbi:unnamed protein product [Leptidea sinapis]|uniref:Vps52 C-terminal domain-containing protein n=1 Tax=Leptidea sinapis TaxID=189913 RepID=A0A5E4QVN0_9NEOP|nr:unnamed protein product [Leptidea sinapis]
MLSKRPKSLQYALVDNSCREYLFTTEFFHVKGNIDGCVIKEQLLPWIGSIK